MIPERRQTKGVARVSSRGLSLSRERRRAAKFELRLCPHNTRRWSTDEGDYILSMRGWPLLRSLLSKSSLEALRRPGPRGSTRNRSRGVPESVRRDMQASGWSSAGLCTIRQKDQSQSREPSYWSDCTEWSNGLDAFRSRDPSQSTKPSVC